MPRAYAIMKYRYYNRKRIPENWQELKQKSKLKNGRNIKKTNYWTMKSKVACDESLKLTSNHWYANAYKKFNFKKNL